MKKFKLFSLIAAMMLATSMWAANPIGCVDAWQGNDGSIYIKGWAYDSENTNAALAIHVYMYKQGQAKEVWSEGNTVANAYRPDVNNVHHCGNNHGFERCISTANVTPGTYWINVWALHAAGTSGTDVRLQQAGTSDQYDFTITVKSPLTISYDANGGSNAPSSQQKCYGININLQGKGSLARNGYTTDGWATSATGNKAYDFGASYSGNSSTKLYAHWNLVTYNITYNLNGGSVTGNPTSYNVTTNTFTLKNPTRTGYTFKGWTGSNGNTPQTSVSIAKGSTGNKAYTANWTAESYTITYNLNGGSVSGNPANYTIETATISLKNPTKEGYTFAGWTGSNGNTPQTSVSIAKGSTGNKTYTANWTPVKYTITYNLDGGVATNPTEYTVETETFTLNNPTKEGFTFVGWTGSNGEEPQTEVSIVKGSKENKSYTANWIANLKPCELGWLNVPEGGVVGTIGHEDEIKLPQVNASQDFILAFQAHTATLRLGSTDESVLAVYGFNNFAVNGVGECDVYVVHDEDAVFAYDSAAFHVTVNPEPTPEPAGTVWTVLKVGDVIKVGDKIEVPAEGDGSWGINGNVLRNNWGPYTLIRADIYQASESADPVVTELEDGAFYVFKAENSNFYPFSNIAKGGELVVTMTSDGLVVTAAENKEFTVAVHEKADDPTAVENVQTNQVQTTKIIRNGQLYIMYNGTMYNVQGARVR